MNILRLKSFHIGYLFLSLLLISLSTTLQANDAPAKFVAGSKLDSLSVGTTTYQNVVIRSISARSATITHDGGMKSILLRELSPELQQRFGYNPDTEQKYEATTKANQAAAEKQEKARVEAMRKIIRSRQNASRVDQLLTKFGKPPDVYREVNLRTRFDELGFTAKSQGYRPSCAIFSIVSALEYQSAEDRGSPETYSEEYLYWATRKALGRSSPQTTGSDDATQNDSFDNPQRNDAGFSLPDVVTGLRAYGIIPRDRMPNLSHGTAVNPSEEIINDARYARKLSIQQLPGERGEELVGNVIHALNAGLPVPIGMLMPSGSLMAMKHIDSRGTAARGHAVTIVGYTSPTGLLENTIFTFRNSWGSNWGDKGYGTITYRALSANIMQAIVLELK